MSETAGSPSRPGRAASCESANVRSIAGAASSTGWAGNDLSFRAEPAWGMMKSMTCSMSQPTPSRGTNGPRFGGELGPPTIPAGYWTDDSSLGTSELRVATIIDLLRITIIDGRRRLQTVGVPVASSLSAPDQS